MFSEAHKLGRQHEIIIMITIIRTLMIKIIIIPTTTTMTIR